MPQPGLEPGPSDPESSTLTTGLLTPHKCICPHCILAPTTGREVCPRIWPPLSTMTLNIMHRLLSKFLYMRIDKDTTLFFFFLTPPLLSCRGLFGSVFRSRPRKKLGYEVNFLSTASGTVEQCSSSVQYLPHLHRDTSH